ncbi:hypothetical protein JJE66_07420 [Bradyrhizobium diazoefficiens]|nr:hypothetical protein [Bradyrhizobium diazoefficiens]
MRDQALGTGEVAAVVGIAPQKLESKTWALKAIEPFDRFRRAPVLSGHDV